MQLPFNPAIAPRAFIPTDRSLGPDVPSSFTCTSSTWKRLSALFRDWLNSPAHPHRGVSHGDQREHTIDTHGKLGEPPGNYPE